MTNMIFKLQYRNGCGKFDNQLRGLQLNGHDYFTRTCQNIESLKTMTDYNVLNKFRTRHPEPQL